MSEENMDGLGALKLLALQIVKEKKLAAKLKHRRKRPEPPVRAKRFLEKHLKELKKLISNPLYRRVWSMMKRGQKHLPP